MALILEAEFEESSFVSEAISSLHCSELPTRSKSPVGEIRRQAPVTQLRWILYPELSVQGRQKKPAQKNFVTLPMDSISRFLFSAFSFRYALVLPFIIIQLFDRNSTETNFDETSTSK